MNKTLLKRMDRLEVTQTADARARGILSAVASGNVERQKELLAGSGMSFVRQYEVRPILRAAESVSLRLDRAVFRLLFDWAAGGMASSAANKLTDKKFANDNSERAEAEIAALLAGAEIFADRMGMDTRVAFAFSEALDYEKIEMFRVPLTDMDKNQKRAAQDNASAFSELWALDAPSADTPGDAVAV